jgi:hypothetical protein
MCGFHWDPSQLQNEETGGAAGRYAMDICKKRAQLPVGAEKTQHHREGPVIYASAGRGQHATTTQDHCRGRDLRVNLRGSVRVGATAQENS